MADEIISAAIELGVLLVAIFAGGSHALRQLRRDQQDQPSLTSELARDLRQATPNPEDDRPLPRTDGEQIIEAFGGVVGERLKPLEDRVERVDSKVERVDGKVERVDDKVERLQLQVNRLADADAEIRSRQDEQSRRLARAEDSVTGPITLELDMRDHG